MTENKNNTHRVIKLTHRGTGGQQGWIYSVEGLMSTIPASVYKDPPKIVVRNERKNMNKIVQLGNLRQDSENFSNPQTGRVYSAEGIAPTLNTCQGGDRQPKVLVNTNEVIIDDTYGYEKSSRCYVGYSPALRSERQGLKTVTQNKPENDNADKEADTTDYRIRRLTPKECWRLMGFSDEAFEKAKWYSKEECEKLLQKYPNHKGKRQFTEEQRIERMSNSQLYKQAGNSIVTDVLYCVFKELYTAMPYLFEDLKVSSYFSGIGAFEVALDRLFQEISEDGHEENSEESKEEKPLD